MRTMLHHSLFLDSLFKSSVNTQLLPTVPFNPHPRDGLVLRWWHALLVQLPLFVVFLSLVLVLGAGFRLLDVVESTRAWICQLLNRLQLLHQILVSGYRCASLVCEISESIPSLSKLLEDCSSAVILMFVRYELNKELLSGRVHPVETIC